MFKTMLARWRSYCQQKRKHCTDQLPELQAELERVRRSYSAFQEVVQPGNTRPNILGDDTHYVLVGYRKEIRQLERRVEKAKRSARELTA